MAVVLLCSGGGAPGVTTTALGLTLAWPRGAILVDADREPTQAVLAGFLRGADPGGRGLTSIAAAHRERRDIHVPEHCLPLAGEHGLLPGFTHPGSAALFGPVWSDLAHVLAATASRGTDVIIDAGRIGVGLPRALLDAADIVLVVLSSTLRSVSATRLHLASLLEGDAPLGALVVRPNHPYPTQEICGQFQLTAWGEVPWQPTEAAVLSDGVDAPRKFERSRLMTAYGDIARRIDARILERSALLAGVRG